MRRLRGLAVQVLDENATGEDVNDQYVDLQSQLVNLEATRACIQEFLNDAKGTVTVLYQGIANFMIWLVVVILPIVLPPALILWAIWKLLNRKPKGA